MEQKKENVGKEMNTVRHNQQVEDGHWKFKEESIRFSGRGKKKCGWKPLK